jgi:hypothetical protein
MPRLVDLARLRWLFQLLIPDPLILRLGEGVREVNDNGMTSQAGASRDSLQPLLFLPVAPPGSSLAQLDQVCSEQRTVNRGVRPALLIIAKVNPRPINHGG